MGSGLWPLEWWWVKEWVWGGWHSRPTHDDDRAIVMNGAPGMVGCPGMVEVVEMGGSGRAIRAMPTHDEKMS